MGVTRAKGHFPSIYLLASLLELLYIVGVKQYMDSRYTQLLQGRS